MRIRSFSIPLRTPFGGVHERVGLLIEGAQGWGEFSPLAGIDPMRAMSAALETAEGKFPSPVRDRVRVNVTIPAVEPERAAEMVRASGCTTAKVKVADNNDVARVEAVRDALGPGGHLRIDANGRWDVDTAERMIKVLGRFSLEFVEQPVPTLDQMAMLRKRINVPLALDESVANLQDALEATRLGSADVLVLKVQHVGGIDAALQVIETAGLPVVISSPLETSIGLAAGVALAASLLELPYACGLGTLPLLEGDVTDDPLYPVDGFVEVRRPNVSKNSSKYFVKT